MTERRNHRRAFFLLENNVPVVLTSPRDPDNKIRGNLLSISQGGFGFVAKKHDLDSLAVCDHVVVDTIHLPEPVGTLKNTRAEIRYFVNPDTFARVAVGCMFLGLPETEKIKIQELVDEKSRILE